MLAHIHQNLKHRPQSQMSFVKCRVSTERVKRTSRVLPLSDALSVLATHFGEADAKLQEAAYFAPSKPLRFLLLKLLLYSLHLYIVLLFWLNGPVSAER